MARRFSVYTETRAIQTVLSTLEDLSGPERDRVLTYVMSALEQQDQEKALAAKEKAAKAEAVPGAQLDSEFADVTDEAPLSGSV